MQFLLLLSRLQDYTFYLLLLLLPTQFGKHFWPSFSFVNGVRSDYLSPTLYATDLLILFLFILSLLLSLVESRGKFQVVKKNVFWQCVIIVACLLVGIVLAKNSLAGWYGLLKFLELFCFGLFVARFFTAKERERKTRIKIAMLLLSAGVVFESFLAISQFFHQGSIGGVLYFLGERTFNGQTPGIANASLQGALFLRPYATFSHPNVLGGYIAAVIALLLFWILEAKKPLGKYLLWWFIGVVCIGSFGVIVSLSRTAIVAWIAVMLLFSARLGQGARRRKKRLPYQNIPLVIIIAISAVVALGFFFVPVGYRFSSLGFSDEAVVERVTLWSSGVSMLTSHPVFGVGLNNFIPNIASLTTSLKKTNTLQPVHNIFLLFAAQAGGAVFVFALLFLKGSYSFLIKKIRAKRDEMATGVFFALSTVLATGLLDHYWITLQQGQLLFSFILGLSWSHIKQFSASK